MTSQKDNLHKAAQDFSLLDQCFPRHHWHTEAGLGPIMGWTTTTRYPEYEDQYHVQFQNQNFHYLRPPAKERWYVCSLPQIPTGKRSVITSDQAAKNYGGYLTRDY
ncbi:hypothetical protein SLE2022_165450 [Rubroshorea leprosula]